MMNKCKSPAALFLVVCLILSLSACGGSQKAEGSETSDPDLQPDYSKEENWAYFALGEDKDVDLFLSCLKDPIIFMITSFSSEISSRM